MKLATSAAGRAGDLVRRVPGRPFSAWALAIVLALPAAFASPVALAQDERAEQAAPQPFTVPSTGTELWRSVLHSRDGRTQMPGAESGVLINAAGEEWRRLRMDYIAEYSGWVLVALLAGLAVFYAIFRGQRLAGGRSGETVKRWSNFMRGLHWFNASLFIILALTGLTLLLGRQALIPLIGLEAFGAWAAVAKNLHNYLGPVFSASVLLMVLILLPANIPNMTDLRWALRGGPFARKHAPVGRFNLGEKLVTYGMMATVGLVVCASGLWLDFPNFGQGRETMQIANVVHSVSAVVWMFFTIGHIYLGTAGVEGTFDAMWTGRVDVNWARQHHDLWLDEVLAKEAGGAAAAKGEEVAAAAGERAT